MTTPVLSVENLTVGYRLDNQWLDAVRDVSLRIAAGQTYGLVGESGSGKSTLVQAVMHYLGANGAIRSGSILLDGDDLVHKTAGQMRALWGKWLSMVPQDPLSSLNPSIRIGEQIAEISKQHEGLSQAAAWQRAVDALARVRIADPAEIAKRYPHQLSGGMQQRAVIAMALSTTPRLLVLDEPTTSLDVTTEAAILDLIDELKHGERATLFVTHNLGVVARMCDRVAVLYASELMEDASVSDLFHHSLHPYTRSLLACVPRIGQGKHAVKLRAIPGQIPSLRNMPQGCVFAPRCPVALELCHHVKPPLEEAAPGHCVKCHRWREIADGSLRLDDVQPETVAESPNGKSAPEPLLDVNDVRVYFQQGGLLEKLMQRQRTVKAVDGVSLTVPRGVTVGLVGESGSGKTSLARSVIGLVEKTSGTITLPGKALEGRPSQRPHDVLRQLQMVFQNPEESLNPYHTIGETLRQPLMTLAGMDRQAADERIAALLNAVHLPADYASRYSNELSGGEKQRVAIARAFAAQPKLIVCDEPVSSLDVSVQAAILNLLAELQRAFNTAYLFISHDLAVVGYLADRIAVIYLGALVEYGDADSFFTPPHHPYTEALLSSIPIPDPDAQRDRIHLEGDVPSPTNIPRGCRFHTRCPRFLGRVCVEQEPPWQTDQYGRHYLCHIPPDELTRLQTKPSPPAPLPEGEGRS
ncbi:MAG: ABC transporter ATP-binding protein [Anaerolineae bacterium]|nr:ABC transporter ATP-binding protein [Anaerolineae bacterium]